MNKIYVFGIYTGDSSYGDVTGFAVDKLIVDPEDGVTKLNSIAGHWSSGENWCKHDMGITSDWKHDTYKELYPDGYELVWLGCFLDMEDAYNIVVDRIQNDN